MIQGALKLVLDFKNLNTFWLKTCQLYLVQKNNVHVWILYQISIQKMYTLTVIGLEIKELKNLKGTFNFWGDIPHKSTALNVKMGDSLQKASILETKPIDENFISIQNKADLLSCEWIPKTMSVAPTVTKMWWFDLKTSPKICRPYFP